MSTKFCLKEAIEKQLKQFMTYSASFLAAIMLKISLIDTLKKYNKESLLITWITTFVVICTSISLLVFITWLDWVDNDDACDEDDSK